MSGLNLSGMDAIGDYNQSQGRTAYPAGYWTGLAAASKANTDTSRNVWEEWNTTWLASPEGQAWAAENDAAPKPPSLGAPAKLSTIDAAQRQRRRAAAGNAGKVTTGAPSLLQSQVAAGGTPRTLIGR